MRSYALLAARTLLVGLFVLLLLRHLERELQPSRAGYWLRYYVDFPVHDHGECYSLPYVGIRHYIVIDEEKPKPWE